MNPKIVAAFVGGLIIASGITYLAVKPSPPPPAQASVATPAPVPAPVELAPPPSEPMADSSRAARPMPAPRTGPSAKTSPTGIRNQRTEADSPKPAPATQTPPGVATPPSSTPAPAERASNTPPPATAANSEPPPYVAPKIDAPAPPNKVTVPAGTLLTVRLSEKLSTERNQTGDQFAAVLDQPLVVDGFVLAERGSRAQGRIVEVDRGGKVKGVAQMSLELTQIRTSDGQAVKINTAAFKRQADASTRKDAAKVGIGAAIGAAIGAIAGGGKGAAVGAGVGGAAGAGDVLLTRGAAAELAVETRLSFRLAAAVTVTEHSR